MPSVDIYDIREWLQSHMPSLSKEVSGLSDKRCHARLCEYVEMDYEKGELVNLAVLWRKLKQSHYKG